MSKTNRAPSRCVFIGNIAYDASTEKLKQIFNEAGQVVNFRMVFDRETNKPKGYAFCEFIDEGSASIAMKTLDGRDFNGRKLRVDFADNNKINMPGEGESMGTSMPMNQPPPPMPSSSRNDPRLNSYPNTMMNQNVGNYDQMTDTNQDPVMEALNQISKQQLYDCLVEMRDLVQTNPDLAKNILAQNPTLSVVLLHIQYILGMVDQPFNQPQNMMRQPPPPQHNQPFSDPRGDPRGDPRSDPRGDPRNDSRDPRMAQRQTQPQNAYIDNDIINIINNMSEEQRLQILQLDEATLSQYAPHEQNNIKRIKQGILALKNM